MSDTITITLAVLFSDHTWTEQSVIVPCRLINGGILWDEDQIESVGEEALLSQEGFDDSELVTMTLLHWSPVDDTSGT